MNKVTAQIQMGRDVFDKLPDFLSVLDAPPHTVGELSFSTTLTEQHQIDRYAGDCLDGIDLMIAGAGWTTEGLVIDFLTLADLSLFSLAFRGGRLH